MSIDPQRALVWIVLLPLFGAVLNGLFGRYADRRLVGAIGVGSVTASFLLAVALFARLVDLRADGGEPVRIVAHLYDWFSLHVDGRAIPVGVGFVMDALSGVMTLVVTGVGALIHVFSLGYMRDDPGYARFFAYLNLFTGSMLLLVLASNLPLLFVGWEGVGLCSYLLIGFWWKNPAYAAAGRKAFVVNRIGDLGMLLGMFVLVVATGSVELEAINRAAPELAAPFTLGRGGLFGASVATVACLLLLLGCAGKSAQIPLHVWLPDAMAGPTPVSALIHAATMVTAGVYLCCRLSHVFVQSPTAMAVVALVGTATALLAASIALVQTRMKKILAYSTVSQLGFMFAGVGVGAFAAGFFHVFTHAFFKACLFLGTGAVMHAVGAHGDADVRRLGGLRTALPTVHWTFLVSCLAIAGVPGLSGFFSKDEILLGASSVALGGPDGPLPAWVGAVVLVGLGAAATMTAFYMFRLYFLTFSGSYRSAAAAASGVVGEGGATVHHDDEHPYESHPHHEERVLTLPLIVLGVGAIAAGWLGLPHALGLPNVWGDWFAGFFATLSTAGGEPAGAGGAAHHFGPAEAAAMGVGLVAMLVGIGLARAWYGTGEPGAAASSLATRVGALYRLLRDEWRIDALYDATVVRAVRAAGRFADVFDRYVVDALFARLTAAVTELGGWLLSRLQTGAMPAYAGAIAVGVVLLGWWVVYPHPRIEARVEGATVRFEAGRGPGYEYRWDLDGDGTFDVPWSAEAYEASRTYSAADARAPALVVTRDPRSPEREVRLEPGRLVELGERLVGRGWRRRDAGENALPAALLWRDGRLVLRRNGAAVRIRGSEVTEDERPLEPGDIVVVGAATVRVAALVHATLETRNVFGRQARERIELVVKVDRDAEPVAEAAVRREEKVR
ncbi:MAG: NADH-quinone oxidoreductase subunit L [Myxococcota bacterium]|nr:NADH-quinone oxidoreductase subunit L [Myxococcota bacterium]MDW8362556.1 NADH-quinone oxidoreductase subunit L [Myxococcales bacterium]